MTRVFLYLGKKHFWKSFLLRKKYLSDTDLPIDLAIIVLLDIR